MKLVAVTPVFFKFHGQEFGFMNESSTFQAELLSIGHRTQPIQNVQGPNRNKKARSIASGLRTNRVVAYWRACGVDNVLNEQLICGVDPTLAVA